MVHVHVGQDFGVVYLLQETSLIRLHAVVRELRGEVWQVELTNLGEQPRVGMLGLFSENRILDDLLHVEHRFVSKQTLGPLAIRQLSEAALVRELLLSLCAKLLILIESLDHRLYKVLHELEHRRKAMVNSQGSVKLIRCHAGQIKKSVLDGGIENILIEVNVDQVEVSTHGLTEVEQGVLADGFALSLRKADGSVKLRAVVRCLFACRDGDVLQD